MDAAERSVGLHTIGLRGDLALVGESGAVGPIPMISPLTQQVIPLYDPKLGFRRPARSHNRRK
jgi:hypothetical protein